MLEESKMDKKSLNRSAPSQSRASGVDSKRLSELGYCKPWPKNKRREGTGTVPKYDPSCKNVFAQRGRGLCDRRPHPRGGPGDCVGGTSGARLGRDEEPEYGSVFMPGSKKQNLNHLLKFVYPTRGPDKKSIRTTRQKHQRVPFKYDHNLYLRAYCQFVVNENGDYKANLLDPDMSVKWEQIEEIVVRTTGSSECPICLGAPVAGRVGLCGHVYCWPCAIHYAVTHEKQPPPCPVCTTPMHVYDMKPTRIVQWESPGEEMTMRLVRRLRGSTSVEVAPPRGELTEDASADILPIERIRDAPYCKLFAANHQQVRDILDREKAEIEAQMLAEIDTSEIVYMEQALNLIKNKYECLNHFEKPKVEAVEEEKDDAPTVFEKQEQNKNRFDWFDVSDGEAASIECVSTQMEDLKIESDLNPEAPEFPQPEEIVPEEFPLTESLPETESETNIDKDLTDLDKENQLKYFYFYQADDGQQIFLNTINVRVLNASWGSLAAAPPVIRGRVLQRETLPLGEDARKHMPCTAHLPLYCSFDLVELDLQPPYVTTEALEKFSEELERRSRIRARNERNERRHERACRRALEGPPRPDFFSDIMFPAPQPPSFSSPPLDSPLTTVEAPSTSASVGSPPSGLSFAKMASTSGTWRVRKSAPPPPSPPEDEEAQAPRALVLSDAIEAALHAAPSPTGKKNKKFKPKVIFATGMQRAP